MGDRTCHEENAGKTRFRQNVFEEEEAEKEVSLQVI